MDLGLISIQPSELFKYIFIIFLSSVLLAYRKELKRAKNYFLFIAILFLPLLVFYFYIHDFGTLLNILFASLVVMLLVGIKYRFVLIPVLGALFIFLPLLYFFVPYVHDRLEVYFSPENADILAEGYQLNQSLITIGSGQFAGRGFGSSLQKYQGLIPEPLGDSIFAIFAEEFGFLGSSLLLVSFLILLFFIFRGAERASDSYSKMIVAGFGTLLVFPAFYNIGAALGVVPLSGMPITFVSKGGTAVFASLLAVGIILRILRSR